MRITQIQTLKDAAEWLGDQALHALIALAPVAPFATQLWQVASAGVTILTIREIEQARDAVREWRLAQKVFTDEDPPHLWPSFADLVRALHMSDRFGDVIAGTILSCAAWILGQLVWRTVS